MATEHKFQDLVSLRRSLDERLKRLEDDLRRMSGDVHAQVEKRKSLARTLELGRRLLDMYEQVRDSPHWEAVAGPLSGDPAEAGSKEEVDLTAAFFVKTGLLAIGEEHLLRFEQNHNQYSLRVTRGVPVVERDEAPHVPTLLSFCSGAGSILFAIDVVEEPTSPGGGITYRTTDIKAFVPSNWIKDFLELSEQVAALKKELELRKKYDPVELDKLKKHFGL
jgi:hypothetical protein